MHCLGWKVLCSVQRCGFLEVDVIYFRFEEYGDCGGGCFNL